MADNSRRTSNVIHEVDDLKDQMDKIQDKIDSIDIGDAYISTINNTKPDENGNIGIVDAGNVDVGSSGNNITLSVDLSGLADKGDIPTVNDGKINLQASNGVKLAADSQNATANQSGTSTFKVEADLDYLNANLDIPEDKNAANDGQINMTGGTGIDVTGQNATANQANNTAWNVSIDDTVALKSDIPPAVVPGDGSITLNSGDGVNVTGNNATANQTNNTAWTVKTDNNYLNANLDFAKPDDIPTQYVKDIQSGNLLTLTVDEEDGVYTLTAIGGGGSGGTGDIAFGEGQCIEIEAETVGDLTTYVINCDLECLEQNLNFVKPDDLSDVPTKTSDLTNDGEDGLNPFITAADIPDIPECNLPIESTDGTVVVDGNASVFTVSTGGEERVKVDNVGRFLVGDNSGDNPNFTYHFRTPDNNQFVLESDNGIPQLKLKADDFWYYFSLDPNDDFFRLYSYNGSNSQSFTVFTAKPNGDIQFGQNVIVNGQVQTDTITTEDDVDGDASIVLSDGAMYIAGTDINESESPKLYFRGHTSAATSVANLGYIQATVEDGSSYKGTLGFWSAIGGAPYYRDEPDFSIDSVGQLHAATTYEPADDNSLITKGYVTNTDGGIGTLPIYSSDDTVKLDGDSSVFTVSTGGTEKVTVDSVGRFKVFNSTGTNTFFVRNDGNVGVGSNGQPYERMTIEGSLVQSSGNPAVGAKVSTSFSNDGTGAEPSVFGFESQINATGVERFSRVAHFMANKTDGADTVDNHIGFLANVSGGTNAYAFYSIGSTPSYFGGQIQTPSITGLAPDTDCQMYFRTAATLFASYSAPLAITTDKDASWINYRNGSGFSYFAGIGTTKDFEISADTTSATFARFRLSTDCTLTAGDGTAWDCPSDDSIMTRRATEAFVTGGGTNATGGYLPLAGGTMDAGADVIIPSGNSVNSNLQVGGLAGDLIRTSFNITGRGTTALPNAQICSWAKPGGNAYFKLCVSEDISSYWNITATPPTEDDIKYFSIGDEDQTWVQYKSSTKASERLITHNPYTEFNAYIGTRWVYTIDKAENDVMFGGKNNEFQVLNGNIDVQPMLGTSTLNSYGLGSDGIVIESADEFVTPEGWDEETQGDPAQQPDQPRSGIAFKGPYAVDNLTQNYYGSIEGVRGGRTNGYKSGAIRISVNSTGSATPAMQQAAYFGWDEAIVKAGNDNVATNFRTTSASIVNAAPVVVNVPITDASIGYWQSNFYDGSRANALGWYPVDYPGGSVAGIGAGGTFLWADNGNKLAIAGDGVRINSQASSALPSHQWEFSYEGNLIGKQGGQLQVNAITTQAAASNDGKIELSGQNINLKSNNKNQVVFNDTNCLKTLQVGSASKPALAFSDTTTGFFFAPDDANEYDTNGSGVAFTIANANSGVPAREIFRINRSGSIVVTDEYVVGSDNSLVTKQYVEGLIGSGGGGASGVSKIIAGSNITVSPLDGTGNVTVNAVVPDVGVTKIIGGTNVTVSPADGTGTVTINATSSGGGADSLVDLDDVVITDPKGNEVLTYDITTGQWINKAPPSGGGGGIIDGGQVPGTGSTFIWYDTKYSYLRTMDGEQVGDYYIPEQPKDMVAYDGVFSDGTFWTLDGVNLRVDPNAVTGTTQTRYVGKFSAGQGSYRPWQGRVIAGQFGYWMGSYFSQDMKQWGSATSGWNGSDPFPCQQKQRPFSMYVSNNASNGRYIYRWVSGTWQQTLVNQTIWATIFPGHSTQYANKWTANQFSGQETAMALETTINGYDYKIYCLDIDTDDFDWSNSAGNADANDTVLKNGTTYIPALDGCTTGFYSERIEKWFFVKEGTVYISNTSSLKGGFTTKTLPRTNGWDRCYDDGTAIVFARTGTGNSATVFSVDGGQEWKVSISLVNRDYTNFAGTNGRAMATYDDEDHVPGFIPDPADPSGEGVIPVTSYEWRYAVSGVDDPNPTEANTRSVKLTHPVSIASAKAIEAQTQEDANAVFTEEIQRRSPVITLTQAEYDAIPSDEIEDDTLYLITS